MKYLVITNGYPNEGNLYNNAFLHRRVKEYQKKDSNFSVFVVKNGEEHLEYIYEDVFITEGNKTLLQQKILDESPDKILVHFLNASMMSAIEETKFSGEILIWVHGVEGLAWYRRLFNFDIYRFPKYMYKNTIHRRRFMNFIKRYESQIHFIFVSEWMKKIFEKDVYKSNANYSIIPNIIDSDLFPFQEKDAELRKKILLIRPFTSKKYANDLAIDAIKLLVKNPKFKELEFTIVGEGKNYEPLTSSIKKYSNIKLINKFQSQKSISLLHKEHGVFLCPTRQDAQGVSMCEAMSSGLVPITSNSTAIPEFVNHRFSGLLNTNAEEIANSILEILEDENLFKQISVNASKSINLKCSIDATIMKELELIYK